MTHHPVPPLLMMLAVVVAALLSYRHVRNARALLQEWAQAEGFRILHARLRFLMPWRLYFTTTRYQVVYQVSLYDPSSHRVRAAWVRLGTRVWGVMDGDAVEVQWDDGASLRSG